MLYGGREVGMRGRVGTNYGPVGGGRRTWGYGPTWMARLDQRKENGCSSRASLRKAVRTANKLT